MCLMELHLMSCANGRTRGLIFRLPRFVLKSFRMDGSAVTVEGMQLLAIVNTVPPVSCRVAIHCVYPQRRPVLKATAEQE